MEYMILIYDEEKTLQTMPESQVREVLAAYGKYSADMAAAGIIRAGSQLAQVHTATTIRTRNGKTVMTDGPFAETKEQLGGYYLIDVANLDEALAWAAKCPSVNFGSIEVRPLIKNG